MPRGLAGHSASAGRRGGAFDPGPVWHPVALARSCSRSVATLCDTVDPSRPRTLDPDHAQPARLHEAARHGRATARQRDPHQALALHPLLRPLEPEDGGQAPRAGGPDRHPPREPRGRDPGRQEGRRPRRPGEDRARGRLRRHAALDAGQQPRQPVVPRRRRASGRRDRRPPRGRHDPQGRGAVGHPLRGPPPRPAGGAPSVEAPLLVHAILETALGVTNVEEICAASPRMQGISFGPADLAASRRMKTTRVGGGHPAYLVRTDPDPKHPDAPRPTAQQDPWHYSIARMVDACAATGCLPFYGPFGDISDPLGCEDQFRAAFLLGCVGAWSLPPSQIAIARKAFSPPPEEVAFAKRVLEAMPDGRGVLMLDGKMQDDATWKQCKVMVTLARLLAAKDQELARLYGFAR